MSNNNSLDPAVWYCYYCSAKPPNGVIDFSENREPKCTTCGQVGFVELIQENDNSVSFNPPRPTVSGDLPAVSDTVPYAFPVQAAFLGPILSAINDTSNGSTSLTRSSLTEQQSAPHHPSNTASFIRHSTALPFSRSTENGFQVVFEGEEMQVQQGNRRSGVSSLERRNIGGLLSGLSQSEPAAQVVTFDLTENGIFPLLNIGQGSGTEGLDMEAIINISTRAFELADFENIVQLIMDQNPEGRIGSPPASAAIVESLPQTILDSHTATGECAICQEDFVLGDKTTCLSSDPSHCAHMFHSSCIIPWLKERNSCPVCRFELPTDDEDYEQRKQEVRQSVLNEIDRKTAESCPVPDTPVIPPYTPSSSSSSSSNPVLPIFEQQDHTTSHPH